MNGTYLATSVTGSAIATGTSNIANSYGLSNGEKPYAKFSDFDAKKSTLAKASIDQAAADLNAVVGPMVNLELGKMNKGKFSLLASDGAEIQVKLGIPKSFVQDGKTYAVICVRPGGAVTVLEDTDSNPATVTFNTTGGQGVYAVIKY